MIPALPTHDRPGTLTFEPPISASGLLSILTGAAMCTGCLAGDFDLNTGDAGPPPQTCTLSPARHEVEVPVAGDRIAYEAVVHQTGDLVGTIALTWRITHDWSDPEGARVLEPEQSPATPLTMSFVADRPGPYRIELTGRVGHTQCATGENGVVNVRALGANPATYRFRTTMPHDPGRPAAEVLRTVWGGANYHHGALLLGETAATAVGTLQDQDGVPVAAYVRVVPVAGGAAYETTTDASDGSFIARFAMTGEHEILVVPRDDRAAPHEFLADPRAGSWLLTVTGGSRVTGTVTDRDGAPLAGASVAVQTGDLPAAAARTLSNGDFALRANPGPMAITVIPTSGGANLRLSATGVLPEGGGTLDITYDPDLLLRSIDATVVDGGVPVPGARVTWISHELADPALVVTSWAGALPVTGRFRAAQVTGPDGALHIQLPAAIYDVVIDPRSHPGVTTPLTVDLRTGQPPPLALASAARISGRLVAADSTGIQGAHVVATPMGPTAESAAAATLSSATGEFTLDVAGRRDYEITVLGPRLVYARKRLAITAPAPGQVAQLGDVLLPRALRWTGYTRLAGGGLLPGAVVELFCATCGPTGQTWPIATAVSDEAGFFVLPVPDPGASD